MINFKELDNKGIMFEQLVRELLLSEGLDVHWTGVGSDGDKDLVVTETYDGVLGRVKKKWIVQCKHNAISEKSVSKNDLSIIETCMSVNATGYLLVCSTQPTAGLIKHFEDISKHKGIDVQYWDSIELEKRLNKPNNYYLIDVFFKDSSKNSRWKLYNTQDPSFWMAYYKKYFIYLSSRISQTFSELTYVEKIIDVIENFNQIDKREFRGIENWQEFREYLMPRAVYYDDKNSNFHVFIDYLFMHGNGPKARGIDFHEYFDINHSIVDGALVQWDIQFVEADFSSGHFGFNHKDYYKNYLDNFKIGYKRERNQTSYLYDDYDRIEKIILEYIDSTMKDILGYYPEIEKFDKYEKVVINYLISTKLGSAKILDFLDEIRNDKNVNDFQGIENIWQLIYLNVIEGLREKDILISKEDGPKSIITLSENGRNQCDYYKHHSKNGLFSNGI